MGRLPMSNSFSLNHHRHSNSKGSMGQIDTYLTYLITVLGPSLFMRHDDAREQVLTYNYRTSQ